MKKLLTMITLTAFLITSVISGCASAAPADYDTVKARARTTIQNLLNKGGTSVSYAVMQDGQLLFSDAVGYLDGTKKTPVTTETLYNIGSVSKVPCAAAVMKLVDEGKVDLDTPVVSYLPELKMQDERYKNITVRMLLNHTSGVPGTSYMLTMSYNQYDTGIYEKTYDAFQKSSLKADPGKFTVYCNDGFMLAEMLVAKVSGKTYSEFVRENIFTPIGAASSGYSDRKFEPGSYAVEGTHPQELINVMGAGGISTNITDLCKFGQMFLNQGQGVISEKSINEMTSIQGKTFIPADNLSGKFGLGWDSVDNIFDKYDFGEGVLSKSGGTAQFSSQLYVIPQYNMVCAISATIDFSGSVSSVLSEIAADILQAQGHDVSKAAPVVASSSHKPLPENFKADYEGIYGTYKDVLRVKVNNDDSIFTELFNGSSYTVNDAKLYFNGSEFVDESGKKVYKFTEADGRKYIIGIAESLGIEYARGQKLEASPVQSDSWKTRLGKLYLPSNIAPNTILMLSALMTLYEDDSLPGVLIAGQDKMFYPMGIQNDDGTKMILQIPGNNGRDLYTLRTKTVNGEEWLYTESYELRPADTLPILAQGSLTVNQNGDNQLYKIPQGTLAFTVPAGGRVIAYDSSSIVYDSITDGASAFNKLPKEGYIRFLGSPGTKFTVTVK
ncbi:MAG: serine hydrolase domain-containing protein [Syntrophomonas sp.]